MDNGELRLVKLARKGDREAFTQLVVANERMLSRVAMATLKNPDDAADAVQDTVLQAWESLGQLRQARYFKTWVVRILLNKCYRISAQRSLYAHSQLEENPAGRGAAGLGPVFGCGQRLAGHGGAGPAAAGAVLL